MTRNLWLPFWIGICLLILTLPIIFILPPSNTSPRSSANVGTEHQPLLRENSEYIKQPNRETFLGSYLWPTIQVMKTLRSQLADRSNFRLLVAVFLTASLASCNTPILPQYISKRYGWTFAEAGYLLSIKAAVNIVLLTLVVPEVIRVLLRRPDFNGVIVNLYGAKSSLLLSTVTAMLVAISFKTWMLVICRFIFIPEL
jgi:hypothetical protein